MNEFEVVKDNVDLPQLPKLVQTLDFGKDTWRQDHHASAHKATRSVYLRTVSQLSEHNVFNELLATTTPEGELPWCNALMRWLQKELQLAVIGRVMFVELSADGFIESHADEGDYCAHYNRYHMAIETNVHCALMVDGVQKHLEVGKIYQIDNKQIHCAWNYGTTPRVHLIFDAIPYGGIST